MDHPEWKDAKKLLDSAPELNYMTQIVFLLFENGRAPLDSEERFKVEVHFSPGAKGREEIIASGGSDNCFGLDYKKTIIPLKRMLPDEDNTKVFSRKGSSSIGPNSDPVKRSAKSLPSLMSQEQLQTIKQMASKNSVFDDEEDVNSQQQPDVTSSETTEDITPPLSQPPSSNQLSTVTEEQLGRFCTIVCIHHCIMCAFLVGMDLATSVKPLQRLCTISLSEMKEFLSINETEHCTSVGSRRSSLTSYRSSTASIM